MTGSSSRRAGLLARPALALALAGCAALAPSPGKDEAYLMGHYILAHEDGYPIKRDDSRPRPEVPLEAYRTELQGTILAGIDEHARRLWPGLGRGDVATGPPLRLLVFVHGGLNGYGADFRRMREMVAHPGECAESAGGRRLFVTAECPRAKTDYYPIFVNWNSDLVDSIVDDLLFIRFGDRNAALGVLTSPFVLMARLAESVLSAPTSLWASFKDFRDGNPAGGDWLEAILMAPIRVVTTPVLKAFGTSAWQVMRRRADLLVAERVTDAPPDEAAGEAPPPAGRTPPRRQGAARTLVEEVGRRIERPESGPALWRIGGTGERQPRGPVEVTLVGHSMGAIVLNRLVASEHRLPVRRIVYLAPAPSLDEVDELVGPYLRGDFAAGRGLDDTLWGVTLQRRDEATERDPSTLLPRGTLLVWIDIFFEPVLAPGGRRFGRYKSHLDYFGPEGPPPRLGVCELPRDLEHRPKRHRDVDDAPHLERILWMVDPEAFQPGAGPPEPRFRCASRPVRRR